jgi:3-isopropylmalate/(R)-2-methylmalate dehydratase large subunit
MQKSKAMLVSVEGKLATGVTPKDLILAIIGKIGTAGGTGCVIEFSGTVISDLSMEGRMTICNMAIEAGARSGIIAVDQTTIDYVKNRPFSPKGELFEKASEAWKDLQSDPGASYDKIVTINGSDIEPQVSWGTSPEMVCSVNDVLPDPADEADPVKAASTRTALDYMGLVPGTRVGDIKPDKIFIGSCTNGRLEDLRAAAGIVDGRRSFQCRLVSTDHKY